MSDDAPFGMQVVEIVEDAAAFTGDTPELHCVVCGVDIEHLYSGRGRKPKFCEEHRGTKTAANAPSRTGNLKALEQSLTETYMTVGGFVMMANIMDGHAIVDKAPQLAHSWIVLAESNPKVRKFLNKMTTGSGMGTVVIAHASLAIAIMANHDITLATLMKRGDE